MSHLVRAIVACFNWVAVGRSSAAAKSRCHVPPSDGQRATVEYLNRICHRWARTAVGPVAGLSRSLGKFTDVDETIKSIEERVHNIHTALCPYGRLKEHNTSSGPSVDWVFGSDPAWETFKAKKLATVPAQPIDPDRVKFNTRPCFAAAPYLADPLLKAAFLDPEASLLPETLWGHPAGAKLHGVGSSILRLLRKWDAVGALRLVPACASVPERRCGLFAVPKTPYHSRLVRTAITHIISILYGLP